VEEGGAVSGAKRGQGGGVERWTCTGQTGRQGVSDGVSREGMGWFGEMKGRAGIKKVDMGKKNSRISCLSVGMRGFFNVLRFPKQRSTESNRDRVEKDHEKVRQFVRSSVVAVRRTPQGG
jgi:hypothetical protein